MKAECFKYKDYLGSIEVDLDSGVLYGKILFINDLVTYEADTVPELEKAFKEAVDDYLETCSKLGKNPDKPFSGTFNVRVGSKRHREIALYVQRFGLKSINDFINEAVEEKLAGGKSRLEVQVTHRVVHLEQPFSLGESAGEAAWKINPSPTLQ